METARIEQLVARLGLKPHPEGGRYAEIFRSSATVTPADGRGERRALTTIYFLLTAGEHSRWHRVTSDEVWHFYEGDPLELLWLDGDELQRARLGRAGTGQRPVAVVPAGCWQAARSTGTYSLVGCTVGPGFDFADFDLLRRDSATAVELRARHPETDPFF